MKQLLCLLCLFVVAAGVWLSVMENILRHPGYVQRFVVAVCIALQGLGTFLFLVLRGGGLFRGAVILGAIGAVLVGVSALKSVLATQHFEGYGLLIGSVLVVEGLLTITLLLLKRYSTTA